MGHKGMWNRAHSSLGTSACRGEDSEHDSLGMGLCTFNTRLHVNVPGPDRFWLAHVVGASLTYLSDLNIAQDGCRVAGLIGLPFTLSSSL